ncbi:uncharacterized protein LOC120149707 [Hibiscus syriacus]|uniref:uncharacterized protein LOC120149707 n=1 Tax=Hibiscus syriacus TaxID=106335 RepID=UPI001923FF17|nr:uncharacterized protein LOC120149707 [Hibiscus syriacus]
MAPPPSKQLKEHLQVQQEPFVLNIYLAERGYLVKCVSSNGRNGCCSTQMNMFKKMALISTRVVKSILCKFVPGSDDSLDISCCGDNEGDEDEFQIAEITPFGNMEPEKILTNETSRRKCIQDDLLLDELSSEKVHHIITRQGSASNRNSIDMAENIKGNFVLATFPWKLLGKSLLERYTLTGFNEAKGTIINEPRSLRYCRRNQSLGNQKKPLMNLSAKKLTKNNGGTNVGNKYNYIQWFFCLKTLGNQTSDLSSMGCSYAFEEWQYCKLQRKIGSELGDAIMDEVIEEVVDLLWQ